MDIRLTATAIALTVLTAACHNGKATLPQDRTDSAIQEIRDAHVRRSEHAKLQIELDAPLIQKYEKPRPKTEYRGTKTRRVQLRFYDDDHRVKTSIEAGRATSFDDRDIMEAYDSVVVIDYRNGDTIYLQDLIWDASDDRIFSEHTVRAKNGNRVTMGDGFTSDQRMENMQIIHQRGIIEFDD